MTISLKKYKIQIFLLLCVCILMFFLTIVHPKAAIGGISQGLLLCGNVLIPSLFPFLFLTTFLSTSRLGYFLTKPFEWIISVLFRIPKKAAFAALISFIGGYPSGAVAIRQLLDNNTIEKSTARRMILFCSNAGPAFVVGVIGSVMLGSAAAGMHILIAMTVSSVIIGIVSGVLDEHGGRFYVSSLTTHRTVPRVRARMTQSFVSSVADACDIMLKICAFTLLFSCFISLLSLTMPKAVLDIASLFLEVSNGCVTAMTMKNPLYLLCFTAGFGGLCVHFQIFSILGDCGINAPFFILVKLMSGVLSTAIAALLFHFFPVPVNVFMTQAKPLPVVPDNISASVFLLLMAVFFMLSIGARRSPMQAN